MARDGPTAEYFNNVAAGRRDMGGMRQAGMSLLFRQVISVMRVPSLLHRR